MTNRTLIARIEIHFTRKPITTDEDIEELCNAILRPTKKNKKALMLKFLQNERDKRESSTSKI